MKERLNRQFPAEIGNKHDGYSRWGLPDFVTLSWFSPYLGDICEVKVEPKRVDWFKENQEKIEGRRIEWL